MRMLYSRRAQELARFTIEDSAAASAALGVDPVLLRASTRARDGQFARDTRPKWQRSLKETHGRHIGTPANPRLRAQNDVTSSGLCTPHS